MRRAALGVLGAGALLLGAAPAQAVVGGEPANGDTGYVAALEYKGQGDSDFSFICGGSLVRPGWVLTAGHCVDLDDNPGPDDPSSFRVLLGSKRMSSGGERIGVVQVLRHEKYGPTPGGSGATYDVALLKLARASTLGTPIALAGDADRDRWKPGTEATALGWGTQFPVDPIGVSASDDLQQVQVPIRSDDECASAYPTDFDATTMLCAGETTGLKDTCQGDSGGPLQVPGADGRPLLVGSVSFGNFCGLPGQYGVYARVADRTLRPWIESHLPAATGGGQAAGGSGSGTPAAGSAPSSSPKSSAAPRLRLTLTLSRTRAGARRLVLRLRASGAVRRVRVTLLRGGRRVTARSLKRLSGRRTLTLRARMRAGSYRVRATALDAQGRRVAVTRTLHVRR